MSTNKCFADVIGFSRKEDLCVDTAVNTPWKDTYSISKSGLFIDELPGMPQRMLASLGGNYDIWEKMANARENAINTFKLDAMSEILKYREPSRIRFQGDIGYKTFVRLLPACGWHGIRMYSDIKGGMFVLRGVTLILNTTENVDLKIYNDYDELHSFSIASTAGKPSHNPVDPVTLPLDGNYYFLYQTTGQAYDNKLTCNCGHYRWCFNPGQPCMKRSRDRWTEWAMIAGVCGDDPGNRGSWATLRNAGGLILHGEFACDTLGMLCPEHTNWSGDKVDFAIANAIWYKTGEYLANYILDSAEISRRMLLGKEQWYYYIRHYNKRYTAMINFIAENIEDERNECLVCKSPFGYHMRSQVL